jgi:hypothetical protein
MSEEVHLARQAEGGLEERLDGGGVEEWQLRARTAEVVHEVRAELVPSERAEVCAFGKTA